MVVLSSYIGIVSIIFVHFENPIFAFSMKGFKILIKRFDQSTTHNFDQNLEVRKYLNVFRAKL